MVRRGVGDVRDVDAAVGPAGQVPQHPAVGVAEHQVPGLGLGAGALDVVQDPLDLGTGEVGGQRQADLLLEALRSPVLGQLVHDRLGAGVLPDDRVVDGLAGGLVPDHRGFALVGDADRRNVVAGQVRLRQGGGDDLTGVVPDLGGIVFHPACLREDLLVLHLARRNDAAAVVEHDGSRAGGALVDSDYVLVHVDVLVLGWLLNECVEGGLGRCGGDDRHHCWRREPARPPPTIGPTTGIQE